MGDELRDGRLALGEAPDDAQAVHVGHDLVERTQLAEVVGLGDRRGDRAADAGGGRRQGGDSGSTLGGWFVVASTTVYINVG